MTKTKEKRPFPFKLGADPEFSLTMQGRKVDARITMEGLMKGKKGLKFESSNMGWEVGKAGNIGWDGMSATAEIRPSPSNLPQGLVNNIATIFKEGAKHLSMFDWMTVSEFGSLGGHLHFEMPKGDKWSDEKRSNVHRKLSSFYLPILMSENKTNLNLRMRSGYGNITDSRFEQKFKYEDGTPGYTYEFRTPSAEWLTTPKIAQATIAYLGVIYNEITNHPRSFNKFNDVVYKSNKQGDALQTLSLMDFELLTTVMLRKIRGYIRTFAMYKDYKEEIEFILNPTKVMKEKLRADFNIVSGWKLVPQSNMPTKKMINSGKKVIKKLTKDKDIDKVKQMVNLNYNDDTNIGIFVDALRERIAAFTWKLKYNYFVFGMRKGINEILVRNGSHKFLGECKVLKTRRDFAESNRLFDRMENRFYREFDNVPDIMTIDFKTGKPKTTREYNILIGLPYDMRLSKNPKAFIQTIWDIEKGKLKTDCRNLKESPLIDDRDAPENQWGEIAQILCRESQNPATNGPALDNNHMEIAQDTIRDMTRETERFERNQRIELEFAAQTPSPLSADSSNSCAA